MSFFLFQALSDCSNTVGPYPNPFPIPAGQSLPLLNLICPKNSNILIIINNYLQAIFYQKVHQIQIKKIVIITF